MKKSKIIKNIFLAFLLLFYIDCLFSLENPAAHTPSTQGDTFLLPPVRRIGIDVLETNVDKFRVFMRKQDRVLYGTPALPFSETDLRRDIVADVDEEIQNTGRFWSISLTEFLKLLPLGSGPKNKPENINADNLRRRLELDYNIDAWIRPSVYFAPDQTLVRVALKGSGIQGEIWAREDITIAPQASQEKVKEAFAQSLARLISTIGHDGKVTYMRENLLTVDFGRERGILRGETLYAGYVLLSSFHPQTGEFLRAQRIPIHSLRVLESRQGSSLCQIIASDKISYEQALKIIDKKTIQMLVWRKENKSNNSGWREPYNPETAPIIGAAEEGFGVPMEKLERKEQMRSMLPPVIFEKEKTEKLEKKQEMLLAQEEDPKAQSEKQDLVKPTPFPSKDISNLPQTLKRKSFLEKPETWGPTSLRIGAGITIGSHYGETAGFPTTILNTFNGSAKVDVDSELELYANPYVQLSFYNASNIKGTAYYLGSSLYKILWVDPAKQSAFHLGGSVEYMGGSLSDSNSTSFKIAQLGFFANGKWVDSIDSIGNYDLMSGFSVIDFVQARPIWILSANIRPYKALTEELIFNASAKRYADGWFEITVGVSWDFLPHSNPSPKSFL